MSESTSTAPCASCGRHVPLAASTCEYCLSPVSSEPESQEFALDYDHLEGEERARRWSLLSSAQRSEVERLLGSRVGLALRREAPSVRLLAVLVLGLLGVGGWFALDGRWSGPRPEAQLGPLSVAAAPAAGTFLRVALDPDARVPERCGDGLKIGDSLTVRSRHPLRGVTTPSGVSERPAEVVVDRATRLDAVCRTSEEVQVEIRQPPQFRGIRGWLDADLVEPSDVEPRVTAEDLSWDEGTRPYRVEVLRALGRLLRSDTGCHDVDPDSVALATGPPARDGEVTFFAICNPGPAAFNLWFDAEGAIVARPAARGGPAAGPAARRASCTRQIAAAVTEGSQLAGTADAAEVEVEYPPGVYRLMSPFEVRRSADSMGFRAICIFEGDLLQAIRFAADERRPSARG